MKAFYVWVLSADNNQILKVPVPLDEGRAGTNILSFLSWVEAGGKIITEPIDIGANTFNTETQRDLAADTIPPGDYAYIIVGGVVYRRTIDGWDNVLTPDYVAPGGGGGGGGDNYYPAYGLVSDSWSDGWKVWNPASNTAPEATDGAELTTGLVFPGLFNCTRVSIKPGANLEDLNGITIRGTNTQFPLVPNIEITLTGLEVPNGDGFVVFDIATPNENGNTTRQIDGIEVVSNLPNGVTDYPILQIRVFSNTEQPITGVFPLKNNTTKNQIYHYAAVQGVTGNPAIDVPDTIYINTPGMNFPAGHFPIAGNHGAKLNPEYNRNGDPLPEAAYTVTMSDLQNLVTGTYNAGQPQNGGFAVGDVLIKSGEVRRVVVDAPDVYYLGLFSRDAGGNPVVHTEGFTIEYTGRFAGMEIPHTCIDFWNNGARYIAPGSGITTVQTGRGQLF